MPIIQSVQRALQILDLFDEDNREIKITDISARLGLHKSTLHSLLKTLQEQGYIEQNSENGRYRLGMKLVERGMFVINSIDLRKRANPFLVALSRQTGQTAHLGILEGVSGVYIDKVEGSEALITYSRIGRHLPIHCTAIGKTLLAYQQRDKVLSLLADYEFTPFTAKTITNISDFEKEMNRVRDQGYAIDDEEHSKGVRCVAVPVFDFNKEITAAVSISTLTSVTSREEFKTYVEAVLKAGTDISSAFGSSH